MAPALHITEDMDQFFADCTAASLTWQDFCHAPDWFSSLVRLGLESPNPLILSEEGKAPFLPLMRTGRHTLSTLANHYSLSWAPLGARPEHLGTILRPMRQQLRPAMLSLYPLEGDIADGMETALNEAGFWCDRQHVSQIRFVRPQGRPWTDYLASRPGKLQSTLRRKSSAFESAGGRCEMTASPRPSDLAAYWQVYKSSWKPEEGSEEFINWLISWRAAQDGIRLGTAWLGDQPVATQIWLRRNGGWSIYKLAHDQARDGLSPGTVLTGHMFARLWSPDCAEIDFGYGVEAYKQDWMEDSRPLEQVLAFNPASGLGVWQAWKHYAKRLLRQG